jgi:DNA recombination protein RmuC
MVWLYVLAALIGAALAGVLVWFLRRRKTPDNTAGLVLLQNQLADLVRLVEDKLSSSHRDMNESVRAQFGESQKLVDRFIRELTQITEKVTRVEETGKQMVGFAMELQQLQDILKNPKQRGVLGEYYLETLLKNVLPPGSYQMQYPFADGTVVDAAVFVRDKIIPIDSKFSLENYNRLAEERESSERDRLERLFKADLKNRIDETAKYVKPEEGTMDFAFMFIPHEAIYYDLLVSQVGSLKINTRDLIE